MLNSKIDINIILELLSSVPGDIDILSIDLSNNTYRLRMGLDYKQHSSRKYIDSLAELKDIISQIENYPAIEE